MTDIPPRRSEEVQTYVFAMCYDRRVIVGLASAAVAMSIVAPHLVFAALPILVLLACPLSVLLTMRVMGERLQYSTSRNR